MDISNNPKKRYFAIVIICISIFILHSFCFIDESRSESVDLVILYANDTHGHLKPFDLKDKKNIGGIARMATLIKEIRKENKGRTLVLHAGDIFSRGTPLTIYYGGKVDMLAMDAIGFDALTPGNGDFYTGVEHLIEMTEMVQFPAVHANVFYKKNKKRLFPPYIIKDIEGVKVAILGLGFIRMNHPTGWSLEIRNPLKVAKEFLPLLRDKADLVIALTHIGLQVDKWLAEKVPQIDIIIGGHSHNALEEPVRIPKQEGTGEVVIVQAGIFGLYLGRLDVHLKLEKTGKYIVEKAEGMLLPIESHIKEDEGIVKLLERYSEPLSKVICTSKVKLANPRTGNSPMGDFIVKAIHDSSDGEVTLLFRGAVHAGIEPGEVTIADICRVHSWRSRVLEFTLTGAEIQQLLSEAKVFCSGCKYRTVNGKIVHLEIDSSLVDLKRSYKVVADEALLMNTPSLQNIPFRETGERVDTILLKYLEQIKIIEKE